MVKHFLLSIFLLLSVIVFAQKIKGKIVDAKSKEPLAFVNIIADNQKTGTVSDIDGIFIIEDISKIKRLLFSYVGYETRELLISDIKDVSQIVVVTLNKKSFDLKEVVINEKENPALKIIRKVVENRDLNNPEKLKSFRFNSYNKMFFTAKIDSTVIEDSTRFAALDSSDQRMINFLKERYIFLTESYTERSFKAPDKSYEKVLASRVSGFKNPVFSLLANQLQSFSFYNDYITIYEKNYLSPIAKGSINKYYYTIEDTLYQGEDSVFIISYSPKPDKNIDGMKGLLYINTNKYAVQNVIAEPANKEKNISIKIQQQYAYINNLAWFPVQLNTDIIFYSIMLNNSPAIGIARSYIENIEINPEIKNNIFSEVAVDIDKNAGKRDENYWNEKRKDTLSLKEQNTYTFIDSIGKANNLDRKLMLFETLMSGKIPLNIFDIDLKRLFTYNDYEGIRLGLGLETSERYFNFFNVGIYGAYGFKDKALKYGFYGSVRFHKNKDFRIGGSYTIDVIESGVQQFINDRRLLLSEAYRPYLIQRMDSINKKEIFTTFRTLKFAKIQLGINEQIRKSTSDYLYGTTENNVTSAFKEFHVTEVYASIKYIFREKFFQTPNYRISLGSDYPSLWIQYSKGLDNFLNGSFNYDKIDVKIEKTFTWTNLGKSSLQLLGGFINGNLPYSFLYNGKGSNRIISGTNFLGISVANTFETMGVNEFVSSEYAGLFFSHNFGSLLFRKGKFKPELVLVNNMMWGKLNNTSNHFNIPIKTVEKGYFETGAIINNLITSGFSGLGIGVFYRYGAYHSGNTLNNMAFKLSATITL
ncbi:MAG: DUF5686 family protein [Bacteroidia bacterium]